MNRIFGTLLLVVLSVNSALAQNSPPSLATMQLSRETRCFYFNPDGSCVQLSIGIAGVHCNDPKASSLPFNSVYGEGIRGGSDPARVANYCNRRGIKAYSVTGKTTKDWIRWAGETNRFGAIGAGSQHFQTLYGYDPDRKVYLVCNNQCPERITEYSEPEFLRLHYESGPWVVILQRPSSPAPVLTEW